MLKRFSEIGIDGSKLPIGQLILFKDFSPDELKSLTEEIQSISNADYGAFDALKIQEYANALSDLEPKQAALLLSTQGLSNAQIEQVLSAQKLTPELINLAKSITKIFLEYGSRYKIYISLIIKLYLYTITFYSYKSSKMPLFT